MKDTKTSKLPEVYLCDYLNLDFDNLPKRRKRNLITTDEVRQIATIHCRNGNVLIDLDDLQWVRHFRWFIDRTRTQGSSCAGRGRRYARTTIHGRLVRLHRFLMGPPPSPTHVVDHISGDSLDNRRRNLRWATPKENAQNRRPSSGRRDAVALRLHGVRDAYVNLPNLMERGSA